MLLGKGLQLSVIPEQAVEIYKRLLRHRMTGHQRQLGRRANLPHHAVGRLHSAIEQGSLAGRQIMADGGFDQCAVIIQVMLQDQIAAVLPPALPGPIQNSAGAEKAIRRIRSPPDGLRQFIQIGVQHGIVLLSKKVRRRPPASRAEWGYFTLFSMSLMVISPRSIPSPSTSGSFSIR